MNTSRTSDNHQSPEDVDPLILEYQEMLKSYSVANLLANAPSDNWFFPGLVCDSLTMVYGAPKTGKSTLVANLISSLSNGNEFLGRKSSLSDAPATVLVLTSEADGQSAFPRLIKETGGNFTNVVVMPLRDATISNDVETVVGMGMIDLVVIDNAQGLIPPGMSDTQSEPWSHVRQQCQRIIDLGVPVVLIHHTSKGRPNDPAGSTHALSVPRHLVRVKRNNGYVHLDSHGNEAKHNLEFTLAYTGDSKRLELKSEATSADKTQQRSKETRDKNQRIAQLAIASKHTTASAVAKEIAPQVGFKDGTVRNRLRDLVKGEILKKTKGTTNGLYSKGQKYRDPVN